MLVAGGRLDAGAAKLEAEAGADMYSGVGGLECWITDAEEQGEAAAEAIPPPALPPAEGGEAGITGEDTAAASVDKGSAEDRGE